MSRFVTLLYLVYALIFVAVLVLAVISLFGGFENELIDPGM